MKYEKFFPKKQYKNSFRKKTPKNKFLDSKKFKMILIFAAIIIILFGLVYLFIYSPIFKIKKIIITDTQDVEVINKIHIITKNFTNGTRFFILPNNNILLLDRNKLGLEINKNITLDKLIINRELFHTLKIKAKEKTPVLLWRENNNNNYYIDKNGIVMRFIKLEKIKYDLPIINRGTTTQIIVGKKIIEPDNIIFIQLVLEQIESKFKQWNISSIVAKKINNKDIYFYTNEGWYIILSTKSDLNKQLDNLKKLLKQKIKDTNNLEYVDLRIEDKIFYK